MLIRILHIFIGYSFFSRNSFWEDENIFSTFLSKKRSLFKNHQTMLKPSTKQISYNFFENWFWRLWFKLKTYDCNLILGTWTSWSWFWPSWCENGSAERLHSVLQNWNTNSQRRPGDYGHGGIIYSSTPLVHGGRSWSLWSFVSEIWIPYCTESSLQVISLILSWVFASVRCLI